MRAYQGEVLGEVLFGGIAERLGDPEHAAEIQVVATLERRTRRPPPHARAGRHPTDPRSRHVAGPTALVPGALWP